MSALKNIFSSIMGIGAVQRQSIITFVEQISFTFIGFLSTMYFAHTLGESVLGAYFLFLAYFGIINMVSDGGFGGAAIKRISEGEEQDGYFSAFFVLRSFFVIAVITTLITFRRYFVDLNSDGIFIWLLVALVASLLYGTVSTGVAGRGKIGIYSTCNFINNVSRIIIQVCAVYFGFSIGGLVSGFVAGLFVAAIIEIRFFDLHFIRFGWNHIKSLSTFSFWLFLTSTGVLLYSYTDTIIIGYYLKNADVGVYRVVFQFTTLAVIATTALRATLWPKVSRWGKIGKYGHIEESLTRAFTYSLLLAVPIFAGGILLGERLLFFFYGAGFAKGYPVLVILLVVQLVNIFQYFFTTYLGAMDRQKDSFKVTAVAASANIMLNLILIPVIGIMGAAVATLVTMILNAVLARRMLSQIITIRLEHDSILNILKASVVMALFVGSYRLFIPLSNVWLTLVPVVLGGLGYGILVLKLDRKICDELKGIFIQVNMPWPDWL
ncbi:MAG: oligosaccharide flippase family protein [Methanosarcinaceae archaeon]|nr:oligosaccharide flippase family protein [Methanosarcinaceae archaeon]